MNSRLEIVSPADMYKIRTVILDDAVSGDVLRGDGITYNAAGKGIVIGANVPEHFAMLVWEGSDESPSGVWMDRKVSVVEPYGKIRIKTTVFDAGGTYSVGTAVSLKDGKWVVTDLVNGETPHGVVAAPLGTDEPLEIIYFGIQ